MADIKYQDILDEYPKPIQALKPENIAAYNSYINSETPMPQNAVDLNNVSTDAKAMGGGISGGIGAGLKKIADIINSSAGQNILAGLSSNPYLSQGYLNEAGMSKERELAANQMAMQQRSSKMNAIGDLIKEQGKQGSDLKGKKMEVDAADKRAGIQQGIDNTRIANEEKQRIIDNENRKKDQEMELQRIQQEVANQNAQKALEREKIDETVYQHKQDARGLLKKALGINASRDNTSKVIGDKTYHMVNGKWMTE